MSYRVKYTTPTGQTGYWSLPFKTRGQADAEVEARSLVTGYTYTVEEVPDAPEPGSTAAHHVEILRERVKELEEELARAKPSLTKPPSVPVGASEAPREGGDSDRRRLEALERYLEGDTFREVWKTSIGPFAAGTKIEGQHFDAPTLAALADKLAEREGRL